MSSLEDALAWHLQAAGIEFEREFKAVKGRRYRWDFKVQDLLIELQGGTYVPNTAHTSGKGIARDCEKVNLAVLAGYRPLLFTAQMVTSGAALKTIEEALRGKP